MPAHQVPGQVDEEESVTGAWVVDEVREARHVTAGAQVELAGRAAIHRVEAQAVGALAQVGIDRGSRPDHQNISAGPGRNLVRAGVPHGPQWHSGVGRDVVVERASGERVRAGTEKCVRPGTSRRGVHLVVPRAGEDADPPAHANQADQVVPVLRPHLLHGPGHDDDVGPGGAGHGAGGGFDGGRQAVAGAGRVGGRCRQQDQDGRDQHQCDPSTQAQLSHCREPGQAAPPARRGHVLLQLSTACGLQSGGHRTKCDAS